MEIIDNGADAELAKPENAEMASAEPDQTKQEEFGKLEAPQHGFDQTGRYFIAKIEVRYGYLAVIGFLTEAIQYFRYEVARQRKEAEASKLIKPQKSGWNPQIFK